MNIYIIRVNNRYQNHECEYVTTDRLGAERVKRMWTDPNTNIHITEITTYCVLPEYSCRTWRD